MAESLPPPDAICDGGDLDCGSGLLLIIRNAMEPLPAGGALEVRSRERSVREDLPAWCRMVGHELLGAADAEDRYVYYRIRKKADDAALTQDFESARSHVWQTRVRWTAGMAARVYARNHVFEVGQPASFDTEDALPSAVEHLLGAVGAALAVAFRWRLDRVHVPLFALEVVVRARSANILHFLGVEEAGHPGLTDVDVRAFVDADEDDETRLAAIWDETVRRCPVTQTILRETRVQLELRRT